MKILLHSAVLLLFGSALAAPRALPGGDVPMTAAEQRGEAIYRKGDGGDGGRITLVLANTGMELPAAAFACANCHGEHGEGSYEGGMQPPPLTRRVLSAPAVSAFTHRRREAYAPATLVRAIREGLDPDGQGLHPGMPRYRLTDEQAGDLVAFLSRLGSEADTAPGVGRDSIRVGAVLPLTGPLARAGLGARDVLQAWSADINELGGVYGRSIDVIVADGGTTSADALEATRHLVEEQSVFALVASFAPRDDGPVQDLLARVEVPLVGPVTLSPRPGVPPHPWVFYLLPTFGTQFRVLVDHACRQAGARLAVVHVEGSLEREASAAARAQARLRGAAWVADITYPAGGFQAASVVRQLSLAKPQSTLFLGAADDILAFARECERAGLNTRLMTSTVMLGSGAASLPPEVARQAVLSSPAVAVNPASFGRFFDLLRKHDVAPGALGSQAMVFAAGLVFEAAVRDAGRHLRRESFVQALERMNHFETGVAAPVSFGPNRRVGADGCRLVRIDTGSGRTVPLEGWARPHDRPAPGAGPAMALRSSP